jgi:peptidoglycan/LPS O-acetylase OafA/YrhL
MTGPHEPRAELKALTGLRAVAALAVVVSHTGIPLSSPDFLRTFARFGYIGVPLFFVLSGFVLAYNYPALRPGQDRRTLRFYIARIARVMPLYWAVLVYCVIIRAVRGNQQFTHTIIKDIFAVQTWGPNLSVAQGQYNGPGWSVGVEIFFYALFPLLVPVVAFLAHRYGNRAMATLIIVVSSASLLLLLWFHAEARTSLPATDPGSAHRWLYRNPLPHLADFIAGMAAAFLLARASKVKAWSHHLVQAAILGFVLLLMTLRWQHVAWLDGAGFFGAYWVLPFAFLCLSLGTGKGWLARFLSTGPLVHLGTTSFALYITHRWLVNQLAGSKALQHQYGWNGLIGFAMVVGVLLLVAEGAHRYVEVPCRRGVLRLADRLLPRSGIFSAGTTELAP